MITQNKESEKPFTSSTRRKYLVFTLNYNKYVIPIELAENLFEIINYMEKFDSDYNGDNPVITDFTDTVELKFLSERAYDLAKTNDILSP